jgi:hypothetical protein
MPTNTPIPTPVPNTRSATKAAFTHVVDVVLDNQNITNALAKAGLDDIGDILAFDDAAIIDLKYPDPDPNVTQLHPIRRGEIGLLRTFIHFVHYREEISDPIDNKWTTITQDEFNQFRCNIKYTRRFTTLSNLQHITIASTAAPALQPSSSAPTPSRTSSTATPVEMFKKGIKRDPSVYPTLKDELWNDNWHRAFVNQARAQDVDEVLDPGYLPTTSAEYDLFQEKLKYVYAILESKVETAKGKAIIRKHEVKFDAQKAYHELHEYHLKSTKASLNSVKILGYITSAKIGDGAWHGTAENFILNWQEQIRLYERLTPTTGHFSDEQKLTMLQTAVHPLQELRQVKATAALLKVHTQKDLTYDAYTTLLLSTASDYDSKHVASKGKRHVYAHELTHEEDDTYDVSYEMDPFDIDTPVDTIQAFASNFTPRPGMSERVRMPKEKWFGIDQKTKDLWDKIDDKYKSVILGYTKTSTSSSFSSRPPSKPPFLPKQRRNVNLHEMSAYDFLQAHSHELDPEPIPDESVLEEPPDDTEQESSDTLLINAAKGSRPSPLPPGDIRRVLSKNSKRSANLTQIQYKVSYHKASSEPSLSLMDRGANGGVAGTDVRTIFKTGRTVDIRGIDNHQCTNIDIGTVGGVIHTQKGPIIGIMHQYALLNKGSTIHSPCQFEWYKNDVNDKSINVPGGLQRIQTLDGYIIPLNIKDGLARLSIRPYTDHEWDNLPHVILTSEIEWDPSVLDHDMKEDEQWGEVPELESSFDEFGDYKHRIIVQHLAYFQRQDGDLLDDVIDQCVLDAQTSQVMHVAESYVVHELELGLATQDKSHPEPTLSAPKITNRRAPDYDKLRPFFGWTGPDIIKKTFEHTTQYARLPTGTTLKKAYKSPNPALNVYRRQEDVACDIVYSDVPAIYDGSTAAVIFVGVNTQVTDVYGIKTDKQFVNTLEDNIIQRGAPLKLISDRGQAIVSHKVADILRTFCINNWQSEPHQQHQNPAERRYQTIKNWTNRILDRTGAPPHTWLLALQYVCYLLNHLYNTNLNAVPLTCLQGITVDISVLLRFHFWQPVYYKLSEPSFPSESKEALGHVVGISEHCGHALTYKVLSADSEVIVYRSLLRPATPDDGNERASVSGGENPIPNGPLKDRSTQDQSKPACTPMAEPHAEPPPPPVFNPEDLIGRSFLMDKREDGQQFRGRIVELIEDHESMVEENPTRIKFRVSVNDDKAEEIITYNKMLEYITKDEDSDIKWKFRRIISHENKGSQCNLLIEWEDGEITNEPLKVIAADDPVSCAIYARENDLLDQPGWKRFKHIAKREKKFTRMVNQAKLRSYNTAPRYKYGFEVPKTYEQALRLDQRNGNTLWADAATLELTQIDEYDTFIDKGHHSKVRTPQGYKKIRVHLIFDVKHDGRHKVRLVADGHLTDIPLESVYSGVVSLRGFRIVLFLAELNHLELWSTDIGNAYLEAFTSEKVFIIAGPEFGEREGHILIISRALYGLRSSGARWHDRFADCIREIGFFPCKAEPDIWMRKKDDLYEYIAVYVDDLAIAMKNPKDITDILEKKHKFKLKGTGPISFHLGMDFTRDEDNTLCISPTKYIDKLVKNYEKLFGMKPNTSVTSPLEKGDHPELDTSELCTTEQIAQYQSMIGALQWIVTIGRLDINTAVMTMSGFRMAPRVGHLNRLRRIYGYLLKMKHASIRIRTEEPDFSDLPDNVHDWTYSVYGKVEELLPLNAPEPLGNHVTLSHYVDANLMHDITTGRSVTGILHLVNKTPIEWYSKKQATVETATYGSEFVAARVCVEQIMDLRNTLRFLGVPVREKSYMFGDNKSVVDSSMQLNAKLHKRHTMLSFHRVREAIAAGILGFYFVPGDDNPADILSKHWGFMQIKGRLKSLLFWRGDTANMDSVSEEQEE